MKHVLRHVREKSNASVSGGDGGARAIEPARCSLWGASGTGLKNRPEPVRTGSGLERLQTGPNSNFKFEFRKMEKSQKNSKNTSSCDESNGVNFFQIFVHLVYFASI